MSPQVDGVRRLLVAMAVILALVGMALTWLTARVIAQSRAEALQRTAEIHAAELQELIDARYDSLLRVLDRFSARLGALPTEADRQHVRLLQQEYSGLIGVAIESAGQWHWIAAPAPALAELSTELPTDAWRLQAVAGARYTLARRVEPTGAAAAPGVLLSLWDARALALDLLPYQRAGYIAALEPAETTASPLSNELPHAERTLALSGSHWRLTLHPNAEHFRHELLSAPRWAVTLGGVMTLMAVLAVFLAARAHRSTLRLAITERQLADARRESEIALNAVTDGLIVYDHDWCFRYLNRTAEYVAGRSSADLLGQSLWACYPELLGGPIEREYRAAQADGQGRVLKYYSEPTRQWLELRVFPSPERIIVALRDITSEEAAQQALRSANARYQDELTLSRAITESIADGVYVVDADLRLLYTNPVARRLLKLDVDTHAGEGQGQARAHERGPCFDRPAFMAIVAGSTVRSDDGVLARADGSAVEVAFVAAPLRSEDRTIGAVVVFRDVRTERHLRALLLERDHLYQLSAEAFCVLREGRLVQANPAAASLLDLPAEGVVGAAWMQAVSALDQRAAAAFLDTLQAPQQRAQLLVRMGREAARWVEWTAITGADCTAYLVGRDVSERQRGDEALRQAHVALAQRNQELQEFAYVASHDLQEPLRKIRVFGERLQESASTLDARSQDHLRRMVLAAERMQALVDSLLAYTRLRSEQRPAQPVFLNRTMAGVLSDLELQIQSSAAQLQIEPLPVVLGDPTQMRQLLQNLLSNALKFVAPGQAPVVHISAERLPPDAERPGDWCRLCVSDQGIGFDPHWAERLFAPFQRLHGRHEYEGSGIGLAIVRRVAEQHGGSARAESTGHGARFLVELPLAPTPDPESAHEYARQPHPDAATGSPGLDRRGR